MVLKSDPLPQAQPVWSKERPTVPGLFWVAKAARDIPGSYHAPILEDVSLAGGSTCGIGTDESSSLSDSWYDGALWSGPISPPPLPTSTPVHPEVATEEGLRAEEGGL